MDGLIAVLVIAVLVIAVLVIAVLVIAVLVIAVLGRSRWAARAIRLPATTLSES